MLQNCWDMSFLFAPPADTYFLAVFNNMLDYPLPSESLLFGLSCDTKQFISNNNIEGGRGVLSKLWKAKKCLNAKVNVPT